MSLSLETECPVRHNHCPFLTVHKSPLEFIMVFLYNSCSSSTLGMNYFFSIQGKIVNIFGKESHTVSITTTELCYCTVITENMQATGMARFHGLLGWLTPTLIKYFLPTQPKHGKQLFLNFLDPS